MNLALMRELQRYVHGVLAASRDVHDRACAENFLLDERPPEAGIRRYGHSFGTDAVIDFDDWKDRHENYTGAEIRIDMDEPELPWTFRPGNDPNRLREIDPRLYLIRVESASWPCQLSGVSFEELGRRIDAFRGGDEPARAFLQGFCDRWNGERDKRPLYATTELEVEDILADTTARWAEMLRDRLGLAHYEPGPSGRPIEILVMRYTVDEVLKSHSGNGHPAIPTVLDGELSGYFFPSPIPGPGADPSANFGRTVNLSLVTTENDYELGCELIHPRVGYRPEHCYRTGVIARLVTMPLERARAFHFPWVRLYSVREDFGAGILTAGAS